MSRVLSEGEKPLEFQSRFLLAAMQEAAAVIRAIDAKVASLFVVIFLPIAKLPQIIALCRELIVALPGALSALATTAAVVFASCWVMSFFCALRTLLLVDNPAKYISGPRPTGVFYSAGLFSVSIWDVFLPGRARRSTTFEAYFQSLPADDLTTRRELAFELMKLVFIRSLKMKRAWMTYILVYLWIISGGGLWLWHTLALPDPLAFNGTPG